MAHIPFDKAVLSPSACIGNEFFILCRICCVPGMIARAGAVELEAVLFVDLISFHKGAMKAGFNSLHFSIRRDAAVRSAHGFDSMLLGAPFRCGGIGEAVHVGAPGGRCIFKLSFSRR